MPLHTAPSRRGFLQSTLAAAAGATAVAARAGPLFAADDPGSAKPGAAPAPAAGEAAKPAGPKLKKAVKFDMIKIKGSIEDKFNLIKSLGFLGVEIDSPSGVNKEEAVAARDKTGIQIHGVIDSVHWEIRLSDPDQKVRAKGLEALKGALHDAKTYGATTVLLVPGKVSDDKNENFDQVWSRSHEEIVKVLPLAKELGVKIAIEVVWNNFITKPEQFVKYIDEFKDPNLGGYFDMSNMVKFGVPDSQWVRALGPRLLKFDFKGYSKTKGWVPIGEGDEDWPEVLKALDEIGYHGWATAEVSGGGEKELRDVAERMNKVLGLA
jgi:hexulose-6-phosphate isomerase